MAHQVGLVFGFLSIVLAIGFLTLYGNGQEGRRADIAMAYGLMSWMVYDHLAGSLPDSGADQLDRFVEYLSYQVCLGAASLLVLVGAALPSIKIWRAVGVQVLGGGGVLVSWAWTSEQAWFVAWQWFNLVFVVGVVALLLSHMQGRLCAQTGARFALSFFLLMCGLLGAWPLDSAPWVTSIGIHVFPAVLVCAWWLLSERFGRLNAAPIAAQANGSGSAESATRQRIAQDVHDGVGAHLVAILSSLDPQDAKQKDLALSLEQCVLDLKIMVDGLFDELGNPVEALAMLRYRVQPCLDRMGVTMVWEVEEHPAMAQLEGATVAQLLKIAQEALANLMRHAEATEVRLGFRYDETAQRVELTIADNGRGFDADPAATARRGKGLAGMRHRAADVGAVMSLESSVGSGTCVRVSVACPSRESFGQ